MSTKGFLFSKSFQAQMTMKYFSYHHFRVFLEEFLFKKCSANMQS